MHFAGAVFIQLIQAQLDKFGDVKFESLSGASARKIVLVIGIMSAHALGEGCGVGVSFCGTRGWAQVIAPLSCSVDPSKLMDALVNVHRQGTYYGCHDLQHLHAIRLSDIALRSMQACESCIDASK